MEHIKKSPFDKLSIAEIVSINPESGQAVVDSYEFGSNRTVRVAHPYTSLNSHLRIMPEVGTHVILGRRQGTKFDLACLGYFNPDEFADVKLNTIDKVTQTGNANASRVINADSYPFRVLQEGEFEVQSKGLASIFGSNRGHLLFRGGIVQMHLANDMNEIASRAPTHRQQTLEHEFGKIGDEIRFGVLKRPEDDGKEDFPMKSDHFTKEHLEKLVWKGGSPNTLYDRRRGHVFDDNGKEIKHTYTGHNLRLREVYYTKSENQTRLQIDENGNASVRLADDCPWGHMLDNPSPNADLHEHSARDHKSHYERDWINKTDRNLQYIIGGDATIIITGSCDIKSGGPMTFQSGTSISFLAPRINLN